MEGLYLCPTCREAHDEPLEAALGLRALCFACAVNAEEAAIDGIFAARPLIELGVAA